VSDASDLAAAAQATVAAMQALAAIATRLRGDLRAALMPLLAGDIERARLAHERLAARGQSPEPSGETGTR
jgi:hypothetical protein